MNIFNFFKQKQQQPPIHLKPGETQGDYIGCYLLEIEGDEGEQPSYQSLAITREELARDCREFCKRCIEIHIEQMQRIRPLPENPPEAMTLEIMKLLASPNKAQHEREIDLLQRSIKNIDVYIDQHFQGNPSEPFLKVSGMTLFLSTGTRLRQKRRGKYIE